MVLKIKILNICDRKYTPLTFYKKKKTWTKILADLKGFTMHNRIQNFIIK